MRPTTFGEIVSDVLVETLVKTLGHSLAELEAEKPCDTLRDV